MPIYFSGPGPEYGAPPPHPPPGEQASQIEGQSGGESQGEQKVNGRPLSQTKRAEQNRKAQRAFRERRDQ
jgi:hypothetical protein